MIFSTTFFLSTNARVQPQQDPGVPSGWRHRRKNSQKREEKEAWSSLVYTESNKAPVFQGVILKEEQRKKRKKEWHGETELQWARPITLFSKGTFIPWLVHRGKWKMQSHTESAQTLHLFCLYRNQDFFCIPFPQTMLCTLSSGLGGLWTYYDPFLIKAAQPGNLFSLEVFFLYISNLCQPRKVLNRVTFSGSKGAVSYNKERTN